MPSENGETDVQFVRVPGFDACSPPFLHKVRGIAADLDVNPNFLMAVMSFETGGTFSPSVLNKAGSGAVGLIQFMPKTAVGLGTTSGALAAMTAEAQLDFVAKHFRPFKGKLKTIEDTYMAVLFPKAVGKGADFVLFTKPSTAYAQNRGLDIDGDGEITVADASDEVRERLGAEVVGVQVLRRGMTGPAVEQLQDELVDLGHLRPTEKATGAGTFGGRTEAALKTFQRENFLAVTGTFDVPTQEAVLQINLGVRRGATGNVVRGLQERLVALTFMTSAQVQSGESIFGPQTEHALLAFQRQRGIARTGALTDETYQALRASAPAVGPTAPPPSAGSVETVLPPSGLGYTTFNRAPGGADQFGRASTIRAVQELGEAWAGIHPVQPFAVGDISRRRGGPFAPHRTHVDGRDVDIRPLTSNGINAPTSVGHPTYSHRRTRDLALLIKERFPTATVLFNDPRIVREGLSKAHPGHENHLHVRFAG